MYVFPVADAVCATHMLPPAYRAGSRHPHFMARRILCNSSASAGLDVSSRRLTVSSHKNSVMDLDERLSVRKCLVPKIARPHSPRSDRITYFEHVK